MDDEFDGISVSRSSRGDHLHDLGLACGDHCLWCGLRLRNDTQGGQGGELLHLIRSLDGIVHVFDEKCQSDAEQQADEHAQEQVSNRIRLEGRRGCFGAFHDPDVAGLETGGNGGLFQTGEHSFVHVLVGLHFALEDVVLDQTLLEQVGLDLLLVQRFLKQLFAFGCRFVFGDDRLHRRLLLPIQLGGRLRDLVFQFLDGRPVILEL